VIRAAGEYFNFLSDSAATTGVVPGDGRLMLDREPPHTFDVVVLDAFSDDAIPVHLLTRQAFDLYFDRLRPGGLLLIHMTNRYLDLSPEIQAQATACGKLALFIHSASDRARRLEAADWAIVAGNPDDLAAWRPYGQPPSQRKVRAWTDEYSSLFPLWR
jgi:spermidine synthase